MENIGFIDPGKYFEEIRQYEHVILFGCGGKGRASIPILQEQRIKIAAACDNNEELWGKEFLPSIYIQSLEEAVQGLSQFCIIITTAIVSAVEIYRQIKEKYPGVPIFHLCSPFKVESGLLSAEDFEAHKDDIQLDYQLLQDEESRKIYRETINWKLTGNVIANRDGGDLYNAPPIYSFFDDAFIHTNPDSVYVDVGAYTGDSIASFLIFTRGVYKKIIGVEADEGNYAALRQFVRYSCVENIATHNFALWDKAEDKIFYTNSANNEIHFGSPNLFQGVDKIADNHALEEMSGKLKEQVLRTSTLDDLLQNEVPSIIKINALAADRHIVLGGSKILSKYKPTLIFEFGVCKEDVFRMMRTISDMNGEYRFYIRRKKIFGDIKTVLYCV